ncbi:FERM, ARHGEF and pleckstrin domain-containing protein 2 isoform X2 [Callorhinchus milii]|uniref:FERM, ARHGEF and pleckstrin domain-containing protein 2 n=1 Tax=Callorhinchus milii TaxID=7868 RepID=A0A4W3IA79_CALMI|nr:FERM, ARHGEF and pleckstrin domain-containing protein 2 isoform X2 [Callorhinchus milii]|eukprot:gi/632934364/ref/XP_007909323.1/ PREDICTED: FERM, RhoGEF and pleckstrin domain-containing protein 2 isoform X1 [Callorhinchus milii]
MEEEVEGTYRLLQTPGARLGAQTIPGVSTLEPQQSLSSALAVASPKLRGRRIQLTLRLLDNTEEQFEVEQKAYGESLMNEVFLRLNLTESDYFGLEFQNSLGNEIWLEPAKLIVKQVQRPKNTILRLSVKFFPPDPGQLQEEYTRYLFALQIKRDLAESRLMCNENTAALLTSHLLQSEIGDYDEALDRAHLKENTLLPNQEKLQEKIMEFHRKHMGHTPAESDFQVLEIARKLEMYGIRFHPASDREGTKINLSVAHMGVLVFQGNVKINTFNWSKIRKLSFKRKRFLIKLHPEVHGPYQDTLEFLLGDRDLCKIFWKNCVEYHTFFRLMDQPKAKAKPVFLSRGSSFRYSGRTQKQLVDYMRESVVKATPYQRRHGRAQVSPRNLSADVPKQSLSVTECLEVPGSPSSATISFQSIQSTYKSAADHQPVHPDNARVLLDKTAQRSPAEVKMSPVFEQAWKKNSDHPSSVSLQGSLTGSPPFDTKNPLNMSLPGFQMSNLSLPGQPLSPLQSPILSEAGSTRLDDEEEVRRKRYPADKAYFIAKEILTTERTYLKDLEVITVWFRSAVIKEKAMPEGLMTLLFSNIDPIYEYHRGFLKEIEQRLALWEGRSNAHVKGDYQRIGDVMLRNMCVLKEFTSYLQKHDEVLTELEKATKRSKKLEAVYKEFELQKVCYLPLNTFLLKPIQRLMHYKLILERLCRHYPPDHQDYGDCQEALMEVGEVVAQLQSSLIRLENFQKLTELQRDLIGIENLILPGREFIREGCLYKLTKKGLQQRMFFLFSDMLLYTSKGVTITNQFKVHGELPLYGMIVEESENEWSVPHCFTIYSAQKTIVVAASSRIEMGKWIEDLNMAIDLVKKSNEKGDAFLETNICDRSNRSSDEVSVEQESEDDTHSSRSSLDKQTHHRANTTMHVCWHRNTSVSMMDHSVAVENQLSGYLLRKFKNSNGWQKLWVVFTNFCLFFYKTHQDDYPLASLPLLGYTASMPSVSDSIHKDYVFKLQFKTHVYFFRAESEYTFERWVEVIKSATGSTGRASLLSQKNTQMKTIQMN